MLNGAVTVLRGLSIFTCPAMSKGKFEYAMSVIIPYVCNVSGPRSPCVDD
jgi:hypothetical protein